MQTKITTTTASGGVGLPPSKKLFKVPSGQYAGLMLAVIKTSNSDIKFSYSAKPYASWSTPSAIASDSSSEPIDAVMDADGNVFVVYCEISTNYLVCIQLTFSGGDWTAGSKYYIYNAGITSAPSITIETAGKLWVSFAIEVTSVYSIQAKSSTDSGQIWGTGSTDIGDTLKSGLSLGIPKILLSSNDVFVVYVSGSIDICLRSRLISGGSWTAEYVIASGSNIDSHFDAAVLPQGLLGVTYDADKLYYREYDGSNWSAITEIDSGEGFYPQIIFYDNVPVVIYQSFLTANQIQIKYSHRSTGTFSTPAILDNRMQVFDTVFLYDTVSFLYSDLTTAASNDTVADVYHPSTNVLIEQQGDTLYLGMEQMFRFIKFVLSTVGIGGTINFSYWDGSNWNGFIPSSGLYNLDNADKDLILWNDYDSVPVDWQKRLINKTYRYWVKLDVASSFSTAPVGSMITAVSEITSISLRR